ncbi:Rrf2 family transcriptional regulator [Macrococcus hajekii]|uniref:HTH-type transcriptional regulator NsrR n=1 Tax=Macrococcus hajekii TaxID=198482 RepID=A0A4V3BEA6_9STAP|nr:Rrf2 family transcriptional regulator [Macrococcus hajekii]TDM03355.1 Rrf2 family transcriptional regulator [Macrococcus hajekii]GGA98164.1 HTH-type transcriptional regulator NsrR [Macrococcus hajekii]
MKLTLYSDYSLRVLMYLSSQTELTQIDEIAKFYNISKNHLTKVVHNLALDGYIQSVRGRGGGIRLNKAPEDINIGALIRKTEEHFNLVECFNPETNTCPIMGKCGLQSVLGQALFAYLNVLDQYTLKDIAPQLKTPAN